MQKNGAPAWDREPRKVHLISSVVFTPERGVIPSRRQVGTIRENRQASPFPLALPIFMNRLLRRTQHLSSNASTQPTLAAPAISRNYLQTQILPKRATASARTNPAPKFRIGTRPAPSGNRPLFPTP